MDYKYPSITIAIPAYNEEENIEWVVRDALSTLPKYFGDFEVIVVDDGSMDRTVSIADKLANQYKTVQVIHQTNGGYGKAMLVGIKAAKKEYIAYLPADGQFLVEDMRHCFEIMDDNDLVLGYRGGRRDYSIGRLFLSYGYLLLLIALFGIRYMDVGWVNIWKTDKVQGLKLRGTRGIFILTEIVVKFQRRKYDISEGPSYYRPRNSGKAKNARFMVVWDTFWSAVRLWWNIRRNAL